ncbi:MAG: lipoyl synthase [Bacteroidales bacterium]|jgi:lipoic acid synthetase|nr:lipoyl synthase [Bacteroidales bacterium]
MEENRGRRKPDWLKIKVPKGKEYIGVRDIIDRNRLHTICSSGQCPNKEDCWGRGTATFMILGNICTRSCKFCAVPTGRPLPADEAEPARIAESVQKMKLKHCVITSVDRDDLEDGGANIWAATIRAVKELNPATTIETLVPDFRGRKELLQIVIEARPEVISHNLETVRRLTPQVRSAAIYERSLEVVGWVAESGGIRSKSGIMLGLGETEEEVVQVMKDLRRVGCEVMTIGQYLQPTAAHLPVKEYIRPEQFEKYRQAGLEMGFRHVESGPLVRSSYHAEKHVL